MRIIVLVFFFREIIFYGIDVLISIYPNNLASKCEHLS